MAQQAGALLQEDYFVLTGGLNNSDSPFNISPEKAAGGRNWEYIRTGAVKKRLGPVGLNAIADAQEVCVGLKARNTKAGVVTLIRAAGSKLQKAVLSGTFTNMSEDTAAAATDFLTDTTQLVTSAMFTSPTTDVMWLAGAGMTQIHGAYSDSKITKNGVPVPTGTITATPSLTGGSFAATGTYFYGVAYHKLSTGAISNVTLDQSATIANTTDVVTIDVSGLTNLDATKYDKIYIYRSAVGGVTAFTTGVRIAELSTASTSYIDTGTTITTTINIPRSGNTLLDNTALSTTNEHKLLTVFKRRLVTAYQSTIYISDLNKSESWPLHNVFEIPSGGEITGLAIISFVTPTSSTLDEFLVVFKENELWVITGTGALDANSLPDWELKQIDKTGCSSHNSIVTANGFLFWMNNQGFHMWDGAGKPILISRPIMELFEADGDLDRSSMNLVHGQYYKKQNQILWFLSHKVYGVQKYVLKLDLRLTIPAAAQNLSNRIIDGVFIPDTFVTSVYAAASYKPGDEAEETLILADEEGFIYRHLAQTSDDGAGTEFEYATPFLDQGRPAQKKTYHKVIAWVEQITNYELILDYWSNYRSGEGAKSSRTADVTANIDGSNALFNVAKYDVAFFDDYSAKPIPITFNLDSNQGNNSGDVISLAFRQEGVDEPVVLYGFSVIYSVVGNDK